MTNYQMELVKQKRTFPRFPEADLYFSQLPQFSFLTPCLSLELQRVISLFDHALLFLLNKEHLLLLCPLLTYVQDQITTAIIQKLNDQIDNQAGAVKCQVILCTPFQQVSNYLTSLLFHLN